jgi:anti-anti-sigma factor
MIKPRSVTVKQLPVGTKQQMRFARELSQSMSASRPYLVLDCSCLHSMNRSSVLLLLTCLEEAIKRKGDVRLAGVSKEARAILELTGVAGLFHIFDHSSEAVSSFHQRPADSPFRAYMRSGTAETS